MEYTLLTEEMKAQVKAQRLLAYEQNHFEQTCLIEEQKIQGIDTTESEKVLGKWESLISGLKALDADAGV